MNGGRPGNRTPNLRIKSPLLCLIELVSLTFGLGQKRSMERVLILNRSRLERRSNKELGWTMGLEPTTTGITTRGSTN